MLMVDSSVWIDAFNNKKTEEVVRLIHSLGKEEAVVADLILTEVLQGFRTERELRQAEKLFESIKVLNTGGRENALLAACNYRILRKKGVTVRKTIDVCIATCCIKHKLPLLYSDKDFDPMVKHLGLRTGQGF